jgi:hypothetical protein
MSLIMLLLECVRTNPGITGSELQKRFISTNTMNSISSTLTRLSTMKLIENRGKGGRYSEWYPIEFEPIDEEASDKARWIIKEMKYLPRKEKENFLARRLQEFSNN